MSYCTYAIENLSAVIQFGRNLVTYSETGAERLNFKNKPRLGEPNLITKKTLLKYNIIAQTVNTLSKVSRV